MKPGRASGSGPGARAVDLLVALAGLVLFAVGLISPLTPSRGCPTLPAVAVFAVGPVLLAAWGAVRSAGVFRIGLAVQALVVAGVGAWLLARIGCLA